MNRYAAYCNFYDIEAESQQVKSAKEIVPGLVNQVDCEPHSMHRINVARAVPLSLTQPHTAAVFRFRADPLVVDHLRLDVYIVFRSIALGNTVGQPRGSPCGRWPGRPFLAALRNDAEGRWSVTAGHDGV